MDPTIHDNIDSDTSEITHQMHNSDNKVDAYFSADVETDGPIPGVFSILSFALVYAGSFDGQNFLRPQSYEQIFYKELRPISENFQLEALRVNGLDRERVCLEGEAPERAMTEAFQWIARISRGAQPVLVAYRLELVVLVFRSIFF